MLFGANKKLFLKKIIFFFVFTKICFIFVAEYNSDTKTF